VGGTTGLAPRRDLELGDGPHVLPVRIDCGPQSPPCRARRTRATAVIEPRDPGTIAPYPNGSQLAAHRQPPALCRPPARTSRIRSGPFGQESIRVPLFAAFEAVSRSAILSVLVRVPRAAGSPRCDPPVSWSSGAEQRRKARIGSKRRPQRQSIEPLRPTQAAAWQSPIRVSPSIVADERRRRQRRCRPCTHSPPSAAIAMRRATGESSSLHGVMSACAAWCLDDTGGSPETRNGPGLLPILVSREPPCWHHASHREQTARRVAGCEVRLGIDGPVRGCRLSLDPTVGPFGVKTMGYWRPAKPASPDRSQRDIKKPHDHLTIYQDNTCGMHLAVGDVEGNQTTRPSEGFDCLGRNCGVQSVAFAGLHARESDSPELLRDFIDKGLFNPLIPYVVEYLDSAVAEGVFHAMFRDNSREIRAMASCGLPMTHFSTWTKRSF